MIGGAGNIGSHLLRHLGAKGEDIITLDNLSMGFGEAVKSGKLVISNVAGCDPGGSIGQSTPKATLLVNVACEAATFNCGYGHGYSVRDALNAVEAINQAPLKIVEEPRRAGDPPELIAVAERIRETLGWQPEFDDLNTIVLTSLEWERKIAANDASAYWAT